MAKKRSKKTNQTGIALVCWILGFLILGIVFLAKQDDILTNLKTTRFFERLFGTTPEFITKHEIKDKTPVEEETVITLKTEDKKAEAKQTVPQTTTQKTIVVEQKQEKKPAESVKKEVQPVVTETKPLDKPKTETVTPKVEIKQKEPELKTITTVNRKLYFVYIGEDGVLSRKMITRAVEKNDSPLTTIMRILLAGPNDSETAKGLRSLIPSGSKLLSAVVRDGVAYMNFNEDFEFNSVGPDGYQAQLMQIVYTATELPTVTSVQFLIEGQKKEYLGSEGVWIGSPLSRASF